MTLFADAVTRAHTYGSSRWEVTLRQRRVRLNVGILLALELSAERLSFGVVRDEIPVKLKELIQHYGNLDEKPFETQPVTTVCRLPVTVAVQHSDSIWLSIADFIAVAAGTARSFTITLDPTIDLQIGSTVTLDNINITPSTNAPFFEYRTVQGAFRAGPGNLHRTISGVSA